MAQFKSPGKAITNSTCMIGSNSEHEDVVIHCNAAATEYITSQYHLCHRTVETLN